MNRASRFLAATAASAGAALAARNLLRRQRDEFTYAGRSAVITGGSRGLGLALARELALQGAHLALLASDAGELARAGDELKAMGATVLTITCDIRRQAEVEQAIAQVVERYGRLDVLINNAGIIQVGPFEHMTVADFENAMAVHLYAPLYATLAAMPHMRVQAGGRIVNISSIGGKIAVPHLLPYTASKFALTGLSEGLRAELAKDRILVTTVCPGLMRTGSHRNALFKGRHRSEFTWFAILDALPVTSTSVRSAARQIVDACAGGAAELVITPQARLAIKLHGLFPGVTANLLGLFARLLPRPLPEGRSRRRFDPRTWTGWDSASQLAPSRLTLLADRATLANNETDGHPVEARETVRRITS